MSSDTPSFVAIGHVTWDYSPGAYDERQPGGAVAFASATAQSLGVDAAIITSSERDYPFSEVLGRSERLVDVESGTTTTFENHYDIEGNRMQRLLARAGSIERRHVPRSWQSPEMLYVGPLTQELPVDCLEWWSPRVSCVVPQGWLRSWDEPLPSRISIDPAPPEGMSEGWDICVISDAETSVDALKRWREISRILVVTRGRDGASMYLDGKAGPTEIPSFATVVNDVGIDATGAGDVFAAAMLISYAETGNPVHAARFASACAALSTSEISWRGLPSRDEVNELLGVSGD